MPKVDTKQLISPSATTGHVLTVQADGTILPQVGGGGGGGGAAGYSSWQAPFTQPISGIAAPSAGTKGDFETLDHLDAIISGQRFEFTVPNDYSLGDLTLRAVFAMSTSFSGNVVVARAADIAKLSTGLIDSATYTEANTTLVPPTDTSIDQQNLLTITEGDFAAGDVIQFYVKRIGTDGSDTHTGDWQVIAYEVVYITQIESKQVSQIVTGLQDTDESAPTAGLKGNFDTLDFATGVDQEQKFQVHVPSHWDGTSDILLRATFAMGSAESTKAVVISTEGTIGEITTGSLTALSVSDFTLSTPDTTNITQSVTLRTIPAASLTAGDQLLIKFKRKGTDVNDTHGGTFQLLSVELYVPGGGGGGNYLWVDYTPVLTNVTLGDGQIAGSYQLVGNTMNLRVSFLKGSTTSISGTILVSLPSGYQIDSSKVGLGYGNFGSVIANDFGTGFVIGSFVSIDSPTTIVFIRATTPFVWNATTPITWATNDTFNAECTLPVVAV